MARTPRATGHAPPPQPPPPPPRAGRGRGAGGGKWRISAASAASSAASDDDEVDGGGAAAKKKRAGGLAVAWGACELGTLVSIMKVWYGLLFFYACMIVNMSRDVRMIFCVVCLQSASNACGLAG